MSKKIFYSLISLFFVTIADAATISMKPSSYDIDAIDIFINGEIEASDVKKLKDALRRRTMDIHLNSNGGDLAAALEMGDMIYNASYKTTAIARDGKKIEWEYSPNVEVSNGYINNGTCASACIFILASAKKRTTWCIKGCPLIVHNPYSVNSSLSYRQIKQNMEGFKSKAIYQFKRVGVSEQLWNVMTNTPTESPRALREYEVEDLGLLGEDPVYNDYMNGNMARLNGYSKKEYMSRKFKANHCIDSGGDYIDCHTENGLK